MTMILHQINTLNSEEMEEVKQANHNAWASETQGRGRVVSIIEKNFNTLSSLQREDSNELQTQSPVQMLYNRKTRQFLLSNEQTIPQSP